MTEDEKYLLSEALSLLGQFDGLPNLDGLEALRKSLDVKTDRQIISFTKNPLENSTLLGELFTSISQKQVIELHFHKFDTPEIDRTVIVHPLPSHNYVEYDGNLNERFENIVGVSLYDNRPVQTILFWVSDRSKDYVATKPIHESQKHYRGDKEAELRRQYPTLEGGAFFSIDCIENYELIRELTSFGEDLIVLSPEEVRRSVIQRIEEFYQAYHV